MKISRSLGVLAILFTCLFLSVAKADKPTAKEKSEVKKINSLIDKAEQFYKSKSYDKSVDAIHDAQKKLGKLADGADAELLELLAPEYKRLTTAHQLLTKAGKKLIKLPEMDAPAMTAEMVSFKDQVAPFLVARCGRCHVSNSRGNFNMASYDELGKSTMVAVGLPADSRIVQVIVDEEMPPGGSVEEKDLNMLRAWISQGAKFDGDNPGENLGRLARPNRPGRVAVATPTGKETISFGLHVAPILIENCSQCHIDTNNPRGNFNMAMFRQLMRGGDSGAPITPGNSMSSVIMNRLTGNGGEVMPPSGKLDDASIDIIRKWISEGATFDGGDVGLDIRTVAAKSKAASQTHDELVADRREQARLNWKLAIPDIQPETLETDNFFLYGSKDEAGLAEIGDLAESLVPKINNTLKMKDAPFLKGNSTIFVFERHYDFSEFGTMIVKHSLPKGVDGFWGYTTVDAFSSVLLNRGKDVEDIRVSLAQQLAAIKMADLSPDIPRWFADGVGYWVAEKTFPKDEATKSWDEKAAQIMTNMESPGDFLQGKLPEHQAALISYVFIKELRSNSSRFSKLLRELREGKAFDEAFKRSYGATPEEMFGVRDNNNRRRRGR